MNIEERAAQAAAWKATGQCNCAQAVLKAFEEKLSVDADTLMKLGAGYAAGMGCMESTCGALIGAVMVAGIVTDGKGTPRISKELLQNFQEKCGATICKDLKGIENGAPLCPCPECVRNAVLALGEVLGEYDEEDFVCLPRHYVIHTVGPIWNGGRNREEELLSNCYFNSMKLARDNGIRSIAFPSISTGAYSFPVVLAAKIAVRTVARFLHENPDSFDLVEWVLFDTQTESVYEAEVTLYYNIRI